MDTKGLFFFFLKRGKREMPKDQLIWLTAALCYEFTMFDVIKTAMEFSIKFDF